MRAGEDTRRCRRLFRASIAPARRRERLLGAHAVAAPAGGRHCGGRRAAVVPAAARATLSQRVRSAARGRTGRVAGVHRPRRVPGPAQVRLRASGTRVGRGCDGDANAHPKRLPSPQFCCDSFVDCGVRR
eukprot:scaffold7467_cov134-Pinguiococcus_pyrenoidosus.AAC.1